MKIQFATAALLALSAITAFAADVTGKWTGNLTTPNGDFALEFTFKQDGAALTGSVAGPEGEPMPITDGKVDGDKISFVIKAHDGQFIMHHEGTVSGDTMKLKSKAEQGDFPEMEMTLTKTK